MSCFFYELYQERCNELELIMKQNGGGSNEAKKLRGALAVKLLKQEIDKYLLQVCSELEQKIVKYHQAGYKNQDIARILNIDIRSVYNANYRIQKKIAKFKCI